MSDQHKKAEETAEDISRRSLLGTAAFVVGAAASVVTARAALARSANVSLDSSARVVIDGAIVPGQQTPEGNVDTAETTTTTTTKKPKPQKDNGACGLGCTKPVQKPKTPS